MAVLTLLEDVAEGSTAGSESAALSPDVRRGSTVAAAYF